MRFFPTHPQMSTSPMLNSTTGDGFRNTNECNSASHRSVEDGSVLRGFSKGNVTLHNRTTPKHFVSCKKCGALLTLKNLGRHVQKNCHGPQSKWTIKFACRCGSSFSSRCQLLRHCDNVHNGESVTKMVFNEETECNSWLDKVQQDNSFTKLSNKIIKSTRYITLICSTTGCPAFINIRKAATNTRVDGILLHNHSKASAKKRITTECKQLILQKIKEGFTNAQIVDYIKRTYDFGSTGFSVSTQQIKDFRRYHCPPMEQASKNDPTLEEMSHSDSYGTTSNFLRSNTPRQRFPQSGNMHNEHRLINSRLQPDLRKLNEDSIAFMKRNGCQPGTPEGQHLMQLLILREMKAIRQEIKEIKEAGRQKPRTSSSNVLPSPMTDSAESRKFTTNRRNADFRKSVIDRMVDLGGKDVDDAVKRQMECLLSPGMREQSNRTDRKDPGGSNAKRKMPFSEHPEPLMKEFVPTLQRNSNCKFVRYNATGTPRQIVSMTPDVSSPIDFPSVKADNGPSSAANQRPLKAVVGGKCNRSVDIRYRQPITNLSKLSLIGLLSTDE